MKEPPIFGPNGAVLNSGTIPPEKINQYKATKLADYSAHLPYSKPGKRLYYLSAFLMHLVLVPLTVFGSDMSPIIALGLVSASIGVSAMTLRYISEPEQAPKLKRHLMIDLILLVPLSYALLIMNTPVHMGIAGFIMAAVPLQLIFAWIAGIFTPPRPS